MTTTNIYSKLAEALEIIGPVTEGQLLNDFAVGLSPMNEDQVLALGRVLRLTRTLCASAMEIKVRGYEVVDRHQDMQTFLVRTDPRSENHMTVIQSNPERFDVFPLMRVFYDD